MTTFGAREDRVPVCSVTTSSSVFPMRTRLGRSRTSQAPRAKVTTFVAAVDHFVRSRPSPRRRLSGEEPARGGPGHHFPRGDGVIEVEELTKVYGTHKVLDALSFTAPPGRVTGFLGPNGSGKPSSDSRRDCYEPFELISPGDSLSQTASLMSCARSDTRPDACRSHPTTFSPGHTIGRLALPSLGAPIPGYLFFS